MPAGPTPLAPTSSWRNRVRWGDAASARGQHLGGAGRVDTADGEERNARGASDLGEALGQEFVQRTFTAETKQKTVEMTRRVEKAMEGEIRSLDWMTEATKALGMVAMLGAMSSSGRSAGTGTA